VSFLIFCVLLVGLAVQLPAKNAKKVFFGAIGFVVVLAGEM